jgi:hypothetical protein
VIFISLNIIIHFEICIHIHNWQNYIRDHLSYIFVTLQIYIFVVKSNFMELTEYSTHATLLNPLIDHICKSESTLQCNKSKIEIEQIQK